MRPPRLATIWVSAPVYFVTVCVENRRPLLAREEVYRILQDEWRGAADRHGWMVGRFVVMPDHLHFFCAAAREDVPLWKFTQQWKQWTAKRISRESGVAGFRWQKGFFDHLMRNGESRSDKWEYMKMNPARAGLVEKPEDWPYQGAIDFE